MRSDDDNRLPTIRQHLINPSIASYIDLVKLRQASTQKPLLQSAEVSQHAIDETGADRRVYSTGAINPNAPGTIDRYVDLEGESIMLPNKPLLKKVASKVPVAAAAVGNVSKKLSTAENNKQGEIAECFRPIARPHTDELRTLVDRQNAIIATKQAEILAAQNIIKQAEMETEKKIAADIAAFGAQYAKTAVSSLKYRKDK